MTSKHSIYGHQFRSCRLHVCRWFVYVYRLCMCVRTFATRYFASQSADHMVQFPRISLSCPRSLRSRLFSPLLPSSLPYLHLACLRRRSCPFFLHGQTQTGEFRAKPWPTKGDVSKSGGRLFGNINKPAVSKYERSIALNFFFLLVTSRNGERRDRAFVESACVTQLKEKLFASFVPSERLYIWIDLFHLSGYTSFSL